MAVIPLLIQQIFSMLFMVLCGFVLGKWKLVTAGQSQALSRVCVYVMLPSSLICAFSSGRNMEKMAGLAVGLLCGAAVHALYLGAAAALARGKTQFTREEQASVIYSNAGNLVIPMVQSILGPEYVIYNVPYILIQNFLMWTNGQKLMGGNQKLTVRKVVSNPVIASIGIGIILFATGISLPPFLESSVAALGACVGPVSMIVTGVLMSEQDLEKVFYNRRVYLVTAVRLLLFPLMTVLVLYAAGQIWRQSGLVSVLTVCLLCAIGPSASTVTQQAILWQNPHAGYVSSVNVLTTLCCVITMPAMSALFLALMHV